MIVVQLSIAAALAQSNDPRHIIVPDPLEEQTPAPAGPAPAPIASATPMAAPRRPTSRSELRKVEGAAPDNVFGRYTVVEISEGEETEEFVGKMERAARALDEDCVPIRMTFDFGKPPPGEEVTGHRPQVVEVSQIQRCDKGGLGVYAEELAYQVPVQWQEGEAQLTFTLPQVAVISDYVRLRRPADGDMRTPPQWLAPENRIEREVTEYKLVAEPGKRRNDPPIFHVKVDNQILHMELDPGDGPFAEAPPEKTKKRR